MGKNVRWVKLNTEKIACWVELYAVLLRLQNGEVCKWRLILETNLVGEWSSILETNRVGEWSSILETNLVGGWITILETSLVVEWILILEITSFVNDAWYQRHFWSSCCWMKLDTRDEPGEPSLKLETNLVGEWSSILEPESCRWMKLNTRDKPWNWRQTLSVNGAQY